ncbi:MAG TPA: GH92 family glycosyl hydrolase [Acidobacteriaceae bacterium]|nr:GH92 family glycosyl hydrolase [Acidobacteriaceae bacterium]
MFTKLSTILSFKSVPCHSFNNHRLNNPCIVPLIRRPAKKAAWLFAVCSLVLCSSWAFTSRSWAAEGNAAKVDSFIGTGRGPGGPENLIPGAVMPFGMVQLSPDTEDNGYGYHYDQMSIKGFSMTHMSGVGCSNEGEVFFTATTGPVEAEESQFESPYSHDQESAAPGYYQVRLQRWGINAELTATDRTGMVRFTFPAGKAANVLLPISHTLNYTTASYVRLVGDHTVEGYVVNRAFCGDKQTYKVYFVINFDRPFSSYGTWSGSSPDSPVELAADTRSATQDNHDQWIGAYVSWPAASQQQTITAQIGISYVDQAGAENNLKAEAAGKSFSEIRDRAVAVWNKALSVIDVSGGSAASERVFYTALYHSLMMPSIFNDADGRYLGFDGKIHHVARGHTVYCNYSGWDIYRSEMPLLALIEPRRMEDMAQSIVLMYQQGGWIGRWPQINLYTNVMAGSPLTTVVSTAWLDGLHGFDMNAAYEGMFRDATQAPPSGKPYAGEAGIQWINTLHYVPNDKVSYGSVSQLQEDAIAYASLYRLAVKLGKTADAKLLYQRALYYRNLFDTQDHFFRPRNSDGKWAADFDPLQSEHGFIEGSGWHYQWLAPADMAWLVNAVGEARFNRRLTEFFDYKKPGWYGQYYNPYNETDLEAPFEFNFSGNPWESQRVVRRVLDENYTDTPDGIPGNDDCGEMSSWAVMSMMGIYSVDPASLAYELVSPVFSRIVIHLHTPYSGKAFTIKTSDAPGDTPYIQNVKLDGREYAKNWIRFHDITAGGTLQFLLGADPDQSWGASPGDAPPSLSTEQQ